MDRLKIIVCKNFYPEYKTALSIEGLENIELCVYPSLCDQKKRKSEVQEMISEVKEENSVLICSRSCDILKLLPVENNLRCITGNYCFSHLTSEAFLRHLIYEGSYIISTGWLRNWRKHINSMGFDKETARRFFRESTKQLAFIDSENNYKDRQRLKEFSAYIDLPYLIVPIELEELRLMLKSIINEWQLNQQEKSYQLTIEQLRNQTAEYSTIFDLFSKISTYSNKKEVINQIEILFLVIFGAQSFVFWNNPKENLPDEIKKFQSSDNEYLLLRDDNRFCIKVLWDNKLYGIIDVSEFLFPKYIDKYLNLAIEISKISGLIFHNNVQYEKILDSEEKLKYMGYHDSMTGLYNRNYINERIYKRTNGNEISVFMFDIDKLKYVNDHFGHAEGDRLIKRFARILEKSFRETDIVARIGGDEFVAILYNSDEKIAEMINQRVIDLIEVNNRSIMNKGLELSVSIGYVISREEKDTIEDLIRKADALMYEDKNRKN